jgi:hypothetical protein
MSYVKRWLMENEYNQELVDFLQQLLEEGELYGAIEGITKQIIDRGVESLKGNQRPAIDSFVEDYTKNISCERCDNGNVSVLTDYLYIKENDFCPMCDYDREKFMRD